MALIDFFLGVKNFKKMDGEIGLEIETETKQPYEVSSFFFWKTVPDQSLRDFGMEYVLKQPVKYEQIPDALDEFEKKTKDLKFIRDSISTSVHVHLNVLNEDLKTLGNFITSYILFENLLIRYSGPDRLSNLFCLPVCDAEETYINARNIFKQAEQKNYRGMALSENTVKYAALNLATIYKYGSLEVRSFRGETDVKSIQSWIDILYSMMKFSRSEDINPKSLVEMYKKDGISIGNKIFGENNFKALTASVENKQELIEKNLFYAASVAFAVKDWDELDFLNKMPKFKPTEKQLDAFSQGHFGKLYNEMTEGEKIFVYQHMERKHQQDFIANVHKSRTKKKNPADILFQQQLNAIAAGNPVGDF